jgi:hypothetical protein
MDDDRMLSKVEYLAGLPMLRDETNDLGSGEDPRLRLATSLALICQHPSWYITAAKPHRQALDTIERSCR